MPILTHEERVGTVLAEKYHLDSILGRGGMGAVFAGTHTWTGRAVAVKLLNHEYAREPEVVERFLQEARSAAALKHPNVVDVLDMGALPDGTVYLVLERLEGKPLSDLLVERGRLPFAEARALLLPVMDALAHAHRRKIVHRDLKPDNIYISRDATGRTIPKLLDFGIAKVLDAERRGATRTGMVLGTPEYMSPEQAAGSPELGPGTDVWSIGVVWYECLTGALPISAPTGTATLLAIVSGQLDPLGARAPHASPALVHAIERALVVKQAERYFSMEAFIDAIAALPADAAVLPDDDAMGEARTVLSPSVRTNVLPGPKAPAPPGGGTLSPATKPILPGSAQARSRRRPVALLGVGAAVVVLGGFAVVHALNSAHHNDATSSRPAAPPVVHAASAAVPTPPSTPTPPLAPPAPPTAPVMAPSAPVAAPPTQPVAVSSAVEPPQHGAHHGHHADDPRGAHGVAPNAPNAPNGAAQTTAPPPAANPSAAAHSTEAAPAHAPATTHAGAGRGTQNANAPVTDYE